MQEDSDPEEREAWEAALLEAGDLDRRLPKHAGLSDGQLRRAGYPGALKDACAHFAGVRAMISGLVRHPRVPAGGGAPLTRAPGVAVRAARGRQDGGPEAHHEAAG